jgi:hypothetical protein
VSSEALTYRGGSKMPKDPTRNIDRYKISGGKLNEFEFHKNQAAMAEEERARHDARKSAGSKEAPPIAKKAGKRSKKKANKN